MDKFFSWCLILKPMSNKTSEALQKARLNIQVFHHSYTALKEKKETTLINIITSLLLTTYRSTSEATWPLAPWASLTGTMDKLFGVFSRMKIQERRHEEARRNGNVQTGKKRRDQAPDHSISGHPGAKVPAKKKKKKKFEHLRPQRGGNGCQTGPFWTFFLTSLDSFKG